MANRITSWLRKTLGGREARSLTGSGPITVADLWGMVNTPSALSGVPVDERTAMSFIAVFAAVRILSDSIGTLPLILYKRLERGKERATDHPVYRLLHDAPHSTMTAATFKGLIQGHVSTWGNGYAKIVRDGAGDPVELQPRLPDRTAPVRSRSKGVLYHTWDELGREEWLAPSEILHIPGLGFDGMVGYSPIALAREGIGLGLAAERFGASFYGNGVHANYHLVHPAKLSQDAYERLKKSFAMNATGEAAWHKPLIFEEGMKPEKVTIPPDEAQFLETRKFSVTEIARLFRVPPHMLADLERATFSNIEQMGREFVTYSLMPWLVKWEQECSRKLLSDEEQKTHFCEFLVDDLLRGDTVARTQAYHNLVIDGIMTRNEVRERENMNPLDGLDEPLEPVNLQKVGEDNNAKGDEPPAKKEPKDKDGEDARALFADECAKIERRFQDRLERAAKKFKDDAERVAWVAAYWKDERVKSGETLNRLMRLMHRPEADAEAWFKALEVDDGTED